MTILGASGALGFGLALRLGQAGVDVVVGSRDPERGRETARRLAERVPAATFDGDGNGPAAERSEIVLVSVPFRSQSETYTNLKEHLREGQLVIDATVPLAAAVSGRATRMIGVWQGSAAQQAAEMVPDGVRVVSALHTVSAATLADLDTPLDEDVLVCGDRRADKRAAAALIARVPGLRPVDCGRSGAGAHRRVADRAADRRQRPLQDTRGRAPDRAAGRAVAGAVVVLAGGTGGAKLARGMLDVVGAELVVIANTADDVEVHGGYVSPDPDLVTFWLADRIDERGWGLRGDTFAVMDVLRELGEDVWFNLGDRDLAVCLQRAGRLAAGATLTEAIDELRTALGVPARVLPPTDDPLRTWVHARGEWFAFQEFMIRGARAGAGGGRRGARRRGGARHGGRARRAHGARAIVIGPSNPVISIGPILAVPGIGEALAGTPAPVVAVSPLVRGAVLKGPTDQFMAWAGHPLSSDGIAAHYGGLLDGLVADERASDLPTLETDVEMADADGRRRVAEATLEFALALAG